MKKIILLLVFVISGANLNAQKSPLLKTYNDKKQSTVSYSMHHPLHSWTGESNEITSIVLTDKDKVLISKVAVSVKIATFDSKNANRDSHVMESAQGLLYPIITFESDSINQDGNKLNVRGTLKFHGISRVISFEAEKNSSLNRLEVKGSFIVKMTQYNIDPPSLMGMATDDDILIAFKVVY